MPGVREVEGCSVYCSLVRWPPWYLKDRGGVSRFSAKGSAGGARVVELLYLMTSVVSFRQIIPLQNHRTNMVGKDL